MNDWKTAPIDSRLRSALAALEILAARPWELGTEQVRSMSDAGLDVKGIEDALAVGALFAAYVRIADAFGFESPTEREARTIGKHAFEKGYAKGAIVDEAFPRFRSGFGTLHHRLVSAPGSSSRDLRQHIFDWVGGYVDTGRPEPEGLPPGLAPFVETATRHAYRITDDDIDSLVADQGDAEAAFELIITVGVASAVARYRRVASVLLEAPQAITDRCD